MHPPPCEHDADPGWLLVSNIVYWSPEAKLGFLPRTVLVQGLSRPLTRPAQFKGRKCSTCGTYRTEPNPSCVHQYEEGFFFPYSPILWLAGQEPFEATFLFPWVTRSKDGREPEVVYAPPRFLVSIADARAPARRCARCDSIEIAVSAATG
jgi:hypothetical protein